MIWPDDVPAEVAAQAEGRSASPKAGSHLRAVPNDDAPVKERKADQATTPSKASSSKKKAAAGSATEKATGAATEKSAAAAKRKKKSAARSADRADRADRADKADKKAQLERAEAKELSGQEDAPRANARGEAGARKGKRELPSYLRVVK